MRGFVNPEYLWLLLALIPLVMLWSLSGRFRDTRLSRFAVRDNWPLLNRSVSPRGRFHKGALVLVALALAVVAAARPYWGTREREVKRRGTNIIYAVDVSDSMLANDVDPSRLDYARTLLRQILVETPGNRVGVMPFAGEAFLQCPLTTDYGIARDILGQVNYDSVALPGTDIPSVIDTAIEAFGRSGSGERVLVLLTDGEDHSEAILQAADRAKEAKMAIFGLGIGSTEGSPIRMPDGSFKEAPDGTKVYTRLNEEILRDLADRTGGRAYIAGRGGRIDPGPIIRDIQSITKEELGEEKRVVPEERYQYPLAFALLCLMIEGLIGERRANSRFGKGKAV